MWWGRMGYTHSLLPLLSNLQGVLPHGHYPSLWSICGYLNTISSSCSQGESCMIIAVGYPFSLVGEPIGTADADASQLVTFKTGPQSLPGILLEIGSALAVSMSRGYIQRWNVHWCVWRWIVGMDGIHPDRLVASVSGLICIPHLEGSTLEVLHHIVRLRVDHTFCFHARNVLQGLHFCRVSS
jgi:hypothetical protein